jgi:hypothetical protein
MENLSTNGISTPNAKAKGTATALETAMEKAIVPVQTMDQGVAHPVGTTAEDLRDLAAADLTVQEGVAPTARVEVVTAAMGVAMATTVYQDRQAAVF